MGNGIASAREIYASEEYIGEANVIDNTLVFDLEPYEIKSFALTLVPAEAKGEAIRQSAVALPYNANAISPNNAFIGGIGKKNYTIPAEIIPDTITNGGIDFAINKGKYNALLADGQTITLNPEYNKIKILCASLNGDKDFIFKLDNNNIKIKVSDIEERPFAWDLYSMKRTAKIKTDTLGWECTHTHSANGDDYAHQLFFFEYEIDTNGANEIVLPKDNDLFIISATEIKSPCECKCVTSLYDRVKERKFNFKIKGLKAKLNFAYRKITSYVWKIDDVGRIVYVYFRP